MQFLMPEHCVLQLHYSSLQHESLNLQHESVNLQGKVISVQGGACETCHLAHCNTHSTLHDANGLL